MTLIDYLKVIRKRWLVIAAVILAACSAAGYLGTAFDRPVYQANSKIIVKGDTPAVPAIMINTYKELIFTAPIMQKVAGRHPELRLTSRQLAQSLSVSVSAGSQMMNVSWSGPSYLEAARIVNAVAEVLRSEAPRMLNAGQELVVIPSDPEAPPAPKQTGLAFVLLLSFVASSVLSVLLAFLIEYFDSGVRTAEEAESVLGIPVVGTIPDIRKSELKPAKPASVSASGYARKGKGEEQHVHVNG